MAGIGFELRKLTQRDDLAGVIQGYGYAALATSGPWLFTIVSLAAVVALGTPFTTPQELAIFRLIVIYNFAFSLVMTAPATIVITRYLANAIHAKDVKQVPAVMLGALVLIYATAIPVAAPFYMYHVRVDSPVRLAALLNFLLVSGIWLVSVFLTALKNYRAVTFSFASGMAAGIISAGLLASGWSVAGMLTGFNLGLAIILFSLIARILAEYPTRGDQPFAFLGCFRKYWDLGLAALAYSAAIWVDKWIMWMAPERQVLSSGMASCPDYESAMFLAYLSIVPSMAAFILTIETGFFEEYMRFYDDIQRHVPYAAIERNHRALIGSFLDGARNFLVVQGSICVAGILLAPQLFEWFGINFGQLGIFRLGLLGAFFHGGFLFLSILISYFDLRRKMLAVSVLFLVTNGIFTLVTVRLGFPFYGFGYVISAVVSFAAAFWVTTHCILRLPYQTFICNNSSVR